MTNKPTSKLVDFIKKFDKYKLKLFFLYRSLKEMLEKYDIKNNSIMSISQFISNKLYNNHFVILIISN